MIPEIMLTFTQESQIIEYARINGYDEGGRDALITQWREAVPQEQNETNINES